MLINVYSKPGCGKCEAAKQKLKFMGLSYSDHNLEYHLAPHEGWRNDGSVDVMAAYNLLDTLPLFRIDGEFLNYPSAMKTLKSAAKAVESETPALSA